MPLFSSGLRYFERVAHYGSIQEASRHMNVAASAINRQILKLEDELGTSLFERVPRGMRLTVTGQALVVDARRWLAEATRLKSTIEAVKGLRSGHVRLATMECLASELLPQLIARFRETYRAVSFELIVGGTEECIQTLMADKADLALVFNPPGSLSSETIWSSDWPIGVVMRADHPLSSETSLKVIDCAPYDIVIPNDALSLRKRIESLLRRMGERGPPMLASNSVASLKKMLQTSNAISFLTAIDIIAEARAETLVIRPLDDRVRPVDRFSLLVNRSSGGSPAVDRFAQDLDAELRLYYSKFITQ